MVYEVLNHNNAVCKVADTDIEEAIKSGEPLPRSIVQAMGKTHDDKYLEYMYPILYHGIIDCEEVEEVLNTLKENRNAAACAEHPEGLLYDADSDEWMEAYDDLCSIYEDAIRQNKGLLFTF